MIYCNRRLARRLKYVSHFITHCKRAQRRTTQINYLNTIAREA